RYALVFVPADDLGDADDARQPVLDVPLAERLDRAVVDVPVVAFGVDRRRAVVGRERAALPIDDDRRVAGGGVVRGRDLLEVAPGVEYTDRDRNLVRRRRLRPGGRDGEGAAAEDQQEGSTFHRNAGWRAICAPRTGIRRIR